MMHHTLKQCAAACLCAAIFLAGCSREATVEPPTASAPDEQVVAYKVTGMTCSGCEGHIRDELGKLPNVREVRASHQKERVWLVVSGKAPSSEDVRDAVKKAGDQYELADDAPLPG